MQWLQWWSASAVCVVLARAAIAEPGQALPVKLASPVTTVLPNGLRVVATADLRPPLVAIDVRYGIGNAMDPLEFPGLARGIGQLLLEGESMHLRRGELPKLAAAARLVPMDRTVRVTADATHVTTVVPARGLEVALWVEAESMGFASGRARLPQLTEWATPPLGNLDAIVQAGVFGPHHPYFLEAPEQESTPLTWGLVRDRLRDWYTPTNATISVAGDVDPANVSALVEKYFGAITGHPVADLPSEPPHPSSREIHVAAPVDSPTLEVAWATPGYLKPDNLALDVAARVLEMHLQRRLVDHGHADRVTVVQHSMRLGSVFAIRVDLSEARSKSRATDDIEEEIEKLRSGEIPEPDLMVAKRFEVLDAALVRDSLAARTRWDSEAFAATAQPGYFPDLVAQYQAIDAHAVAAAVSRGLTEAGSVTVHVEPKPVHNGGIAEDAPRRAFRAPRAAGARRQEDRSLWYHVPGAVSAPQFAVAQAKETSTATGVRVVTLTRGPSPLARLRVFAPWSAPVPSLETLRAIPQAVALTLAEGVPLETALLSLGTVPTFTGDAAGLSVSVSATPDAVDGALRLILKTLRHPSLPKDAAEVLRKRLSAQSSARSGSPVSSRELFQVAEWSSGPPPDVPTTTPFKPDELDRAVRTAWARSFTAFFVGALSLDEASRAVTLADGGAPGRVRSAPLIATEARGTASRYDLVEDDRASNASLVFSCVIPDSVAPIAAAVSLPSFLNGVFADLRAGKPTPNGYEPGVIVHSESAHAVWLGASTLVHFGFVVPASRDGVQKAVTALLDRVDALKKGDFTPVDIRRSSQDMKAWLVSGLDATGTELERLYELGPDGLTAYSAFSPNTELRDVQSAMRHCFASESLHVVGYGRVREAAAALKEGGYGPIVVSSRGDGAAR